MAFSGVWRSLVPLVLMALLVVLITGRATGEPSHCIKWIEFNRSLTAVREELQGCPVACNSTQIEPKCKCLSLNTSESCKLPRYLISGVEALNSTLPNRWLDILSIKRKLFTFKKCYQKFLGSLNVSCEASPSPGSFIGTLTDVQRKILSSREK